MSTTSAAPSSALTKEEIRGALKTRKTVRSLWERRISMIAAHPGSEAEIDEAYAQIRDDLMGDHTFAGGL